jgi:D-amino-acid dehydrogenase
MNIVIVGGGVIGTACAYYLQRAGATVTVVDAAEPGQACSRGNCGFICPSHVLPLAGPGVIGPTLRALLTPNGPLRIAPRFDPALWHWLWQFARKCNRRDMLRTGQALQALLQSSRHLYGQLLADEPLAVEWQERGLLFVFQTAAAMDHYAHTDALMHREFDLGAVRYDGPALTAFEPALKPGLAGGWHYPDDAHLRPDRLMAGWRELLTARGVVFRSGTRVTGIVGAPTVTGVQTSAGPLPADAVVVAAGAWTPQLRAWLGGTIPIQPGKGYSLTMARPTQCPRVPLIFEEHRVAITPMQSGYRIGSTMEFAGYDATLNRARLDLLRAGARHYLHEPEAEPVQDEWWGWRPMVHDGLPLIGRSAAHANVWLAAGHGMLGLSLATGTGKLVTELLAGTPPHVPATPYAPARFA